jgi:DNA-binding transcriptional MocR family regulator
MRDQAEGDAVEVLVEALRSRLAVGQTLPAERLLAEELSVKRHRLRAALGALRAAGSSPRPSPAAVPSSRRRWTSRARPIRSRSSSCASCWSPRWPVWRRCAPRPPRSHASSGRRHTPSLAAAAATDLAFHLAVAAGARNGWRPELYAQLRRIGRDARLSVAGMGQPCQARVQQRDAEHRAVADAIAERDPGARRGRDAGTSARGAATGDGTAVAGPDGS